MDYLFCRPIIYIKVSELEIKHKHGGFNINYEKASIVVWQRFGLGNPNSSDNPVCLSVQSYGTYCQQVLFYWFAVPVADDSMSKNLLHKLERLA
jgi:hypothetical protein